MFCPSITRCYYDVFKFLFIDTWDELEYNFLTFKVENEQFSSTVVRYGCNETMTLGSVVVYGIGSLISSVTINGKIHPSFLYDRSSEVSLSLTCVVHIIYNIRI